MKVNHSFASSIISPNKHQPTGNLTTNLIRKYLGNFAAAPGRFFDSDRVSKGFNNIELNLNNLFSRVQHVVSVLHWLKTSKAVMCPT